MYLEVDQDTKKGCVIGIEVSNPFSYGWNYACAQWAIYDGKGLTRSREYQRHRGSDPEKKELVAIEKSLSNRLIFK